MDERNGFGIMSWTDGSVYEGDWVKGIQHGYGKMKFPDGTIKEGYFENNVFKGEDKPYVIGNGPMTRANNSSGVFAKANKSIDSLTPVK